MKYIQYNCKLQAKPTFVSFWHFWLKSLTATLTPFGNTVGGGRIVISCLFSVSVLFLNPQIPPQTPQTQWCLDVNEKKNVHGVLIVYTQWYFNIFWVGKQKKMKWSNEGFSRTLRPKEADFEDEKKNFTIKNNLAFQLCFYVLWYFSH